MVKKIRVLKKNNYLWGVIGTGVATEIAQNKKFCRIYIRIFHIVMIAGCVKDYPYIPVGLILKDKYENNKKIKNINLTSFSNAWRSR